MNTLTSQQVADLIKSHLIVTPNTHDDTVRAIVDRFARQFWLQDGKFDRDQFMIDCGYLPNGGRRD